MAYKDREDKLSNQELDDWKWHITIYLVKFSWTHYQVLRRIENRDERDFYENEAIRSNRNVNTLKRQCHSSLYERLALNRDKNDVMRLANEGAVPQIP